MSHRSYALLALVGVVLIGATLVVVSGKYSLGFSRFFAAEEGAVEALPSNGDSASTGQALQDEVIGFCSPSELTVSVGAPAILRSRAATAQWFAPEASLVEGVGSSFMTSYMTAGVKRVTVQIPRADGSSIIDSAVCTVIVQ